MNICLTYVKLVIMKILSDKKFFSVSEAASIIGVSRVTVFLWIKKGIILAEKVGRNYVISHDELLKHIDRRPINEEEKKQVKAALDRAILDYGETIKMLGNE